MKKPVILDNGLVDRFLKDGLISPDECKDIARRFDDRWADAELKRRSAGRSAEGVQQFRDVIAEERIQRCINAVLATARPRMTETDSLGRPLCRLTSLCGGGWCSSRGRSRTLSNKRPRYLPKAVSITDGTTI